MRRGEIGTILCVAALALLVGRTPVCAAEPAFHASVDRARASQSEPIRLTLTLTAPASLDHVPSPELDLTQFDVYGPSMSTRMEMVNGRTTFSRELIYTLYGRKLGRIRIGPATMKIGDRTLTSEAIDVEIVRRSTTPAAAGKDGGGPVAGAEESIFLRASADHDTVYVGQQVVVRFDLYYRSTLRDVGFADIPKFTGFWLKDLFVAQRLAPERQVVGGVAYNMAPLRRVALFPTGSGVQSVDAMAVSCSIPSGRSRGSLFDALSMFDDPVGGRGQTLLVRSESLPIQVLPLPQAGQPADFSGAVGQFTLTGEAQPRQVRAGDPVTLRLTIEGNGNVSAIPAPELAPRGFEVYAPTTELEEGQTPTGAYGARRKLEYILIPESGGRRQIPAITVSYFDPASRQYRTASTGPFDIQVEAGDQPAAAAPTYDMTRREIEQLGRDIRHIKPDADDLGAGTPLYRSALYWILHGALPLAYVGLLAYQRHRRRLEGDEAYARRRRARGEAARRLSTARDRVDAGTGFHAALQEAVVVYIADRLNRPAPGLTRDVCRRLLSERGIPAPLVDGIDRLLERCEFGRFAPSASGLDDRHALLEEGEDLVERLREALS